MVPTQGRIFRDAVQELLAECRDEYSAALRTRSGNFLLCRRCVRATGLRTAASREGRH